MRTDIYVHTKVVDLEPGTLLKRGDVVRENRQGSKPEKVIRQRENMVLTESGNEYHTTKIVRA